MWAWPYFFYKSLSILQVYALFPRIPLADALLRVFLDSALLSLMQIAFYEEADLPEGCFVISEGGLSDDFLAHFGDMCVKSK